MCTSTKWMVVLAVVMLTMLLWEFYLYGEVTVYEDIVDKRTLKLTSKKKSSPQTLKNVLFVKKIKKRQNCQKPPVLNRILGCWHQKPGEINCIGCYWMRFWIWSESIIVTYFYSHQRKLILQHWVCCIVCLRQKQTRKTRNFIK